MKKLLTFLVPSVVLLILTISVFAMNNTQLFMPMVYQGRPTNTPTITPEPTATPEPEKQYDWDAVSCSWILGARKIPGGGGTEIWASVPSFCHDLAVHEYQQDGQVVIVRSVRIVTNTFGCMEGDFGSWPPQDETCPPSPQPVDPFEWGDIESFTIDRSVQWVCSYCPSNAYPHTCNCLKPE